MAQKVSVVVKTLSTFGANLDLAISMKLSCMLLQIFILVEIFATLFTHDSFKRWIFARFLSMLVEMVSIQSFLRFVLGSTKCANSQLGLFLPRFLPSVSLLMFLDMNHQIGHVFILFFALRTSQQTILVFFNFHWNLI